MIKIEYCFLGAKRKWRCFGTTNNPVHAQEILEVCRVNFPGSRYRVRRPIEAARGVLAS